MSASSARWALRVAQKAQRAPRAPVAAPTKASRSMLPQEKKPRRASSTRRGDRPPTPRDSGSQRPKSPSRASRLPTRPRKAPSRSSGVRMKLSEAPTRRMIVISSSRARMLMRMTLPVAKPAASSSTVPRVARADRSIRAMRWRFSSRSWSTSTSPTPGMPRRLSPTSTALPPEAKSWRRVSSRLSGRASWPALSSSRPASRVADRKRRRFSSADMRRTSRKRGSRCSRPAVSSRLRPSAA